MDRILVSGSTIKNTFQVEGGDMYDNVIALRNTVVSGGELRVMYEGIANSTTVNERGRLTISNSGIASNTIINSGGTMMFAPATSGGSAVRTTINSGGVLIGRGSFFLSETTINRGAVFSTVNPVSSLILDIVENGGFVSSNSRNIFTFASNTFTGKVLSDMDSATVHSGTTANSTTIRNGGRLVVFSSGSANQTYVSEGGLLQISSGGTANHVSISSDGALYASFGGKLTGQMTFADGAEITMDEYTTLDFDISGCTAGAGARVNNLSLIQ